MRSLRDLCVSVVNHAQIRSPQRRRGRRVRAENFKLDTARTRVSQVSAPSHKTEDRQVHAYTEHEKVSLTLLIERDFFISADHL